MDRNNNRNNNRDNRNNRNDRNECKDRNNVEFGTFSSVPGMSQEAIAGTQNAAQKNRSNAQMNALNKQNKTQTEFAQGIGAQGYNAYSSEAKSRTQAAVQQNKQSSSQGQSK